MIDESQKPTTDAYRNGWDAIWGEKDKNKSHPLIKVHAARDAYVGPDGREVSGEEVSRNVLPDETYSHCAARLLGLE